MENSVRKHAPAIEPRFTPAVRRALVSSLTTTLVIALFAAGLLVSRATANSTPPGPVGAATNLSTRAGYLMLGANGDVHPFGAARDLGGDAVFATAIAPKSNG